MTTPLTPILATDCAVFNSAGSVLLIRRRNPPFKGYFALPGGFVEVGETVERACRRELFEETALELDGLWLVGVYSDPKRDPRGHVCSVAFASRVKDDKAIAGDDAAGVEWVGDWRAVNLAFDHGRIIADAWRLIASL